MTLIGLKIMLRNYKRTIALLTAFTLLLIGVIASVSSSNAYGLRSIELEIERSRPNILVSLMPYLGSNSSLEEAIRILEDVGSELSDRDLPVAEWCVYTEYPGPLYVKGASGDEWWKERLVLASDGDIVQINPRFIGPESTFPPEGEPGPVVKEVEPKPVYVVRLDIVSLKSLDSIGVLGLKVVEDRLDDYRGSGKIPVLVNDAVMRLLGLDMGDEVPGPGNSSFVVAGVFTGILHISNAYGSDLKVPADRVSGFIALMEDVKPHYRPGLPLYRVDTRLIYEEYAGNPSAETIIRPLGGYMPSAYLAVNLDIEKLGLENPREAAMRAANIINSIGDIFSGIDGVLADIPRIKIVDGELQIFGPRGQEIYRASWAAELVRGEGTVGSILEGSKLSLGPVALSQGVIVPLLLVLGYLVSGGLLELLLEDARRFFRLVAHRGGSPIFAKHSLLYLLVFSSIITLVVGLPLASALSYLSNRVLMGIHYPRSPWQILGNQVYLCIGAGTVIVSALALYMSNRRRLWETPSSHGKRRRASLGLLVIAVISYALGILRATSASMEGLVDQNPVLGFPLALIIIISFILSPFMPLVLSYSFSVFISRTRAFESLAMRLARVLGGPLGEPAAASASRIRSVVERQIDIMVFSMGLAFGSALIWPGIESRLPSLAEALASRGWYADMMENYISVASLMASSIKVLLGYSIIIAVAGAYALSAGIIGRVEGEAVVVRARGASKRDVARLIYGVTASGIIAGIIAGILVGLVFASAIDAYLGFSFFFSVYDSRMGPPPHFLPWMNTWSLVSVLAMLLLVLPAPLLAGLDVFSENISETLRRLGEEKWWVRE